jgi:hypothetical protein
MSQENVEIVERIYAEVSRSGMLPREWVLTVLPCHRLR